MTNGLRVAALAATVALTTRSYGDTAKAKTMTPQRTKYVEVALKSDLYPKLTQKEKGMVRLLIEACREMDSIFWRESFGGEARALLGRILEPELRQFAEINYGPWDRLNANAPFLLGVGEKPKGAGYYPTDASKTEIDQAAAADPRIKSPYTVVRREAGGKLVAIPYHVTFSEQVQRAAGKLRAAAVFAEGCRAPELSRASRQGPDRRRLPRERPRMDGHEAERHRRRDRPHREL
jgi:hypothetical protein